MNAAMTTEQAELQGALLKRGRKTFWVCGTSGSKAQVHVYSTNGTPKSFPMNVAEAQRLVVRPARATDMDPAHEMSAQRKAEQFAAMGSRALLDLALVVLHRGA